jgi:DNA-binding CsgD family transcriptional regulator
VVAVGAYAVAPILTEGRVTGFLHANRRGAGGFIDEIDQLVLSAFAEGFGCAFERTVLRERLRAQVDHVREVMETTAHLLDEAIAGEIGGPQDGAAPAERVGLALADADLPASGRLAASVPVALTRREVEVVELIATGETNAGIAERLLISESTVKSHVKHILRKLGAGHRAEAVSRCLAGEMRT